MPDQLDWLRYLGSFALVLGLLGITLYLLRRWSSGQPLSSASRLGGRRRLRLLDSLHLGQRQRLLIVEAEGQRLLIGVGPQEVRTLAQLGPSTDLSSRENNGNETTGAEPNAERQDLA